MVGGTLNPKPACMRREPLGLKQLSLLPNASLKHLWHREKKAFLMKILKDLHPKKKLYRAYNDFRARSQH